MTEAKVRYGGPRQLSVSYLFVAIAAVGLTLPVAGWSEIVRISNAMGGGPGNDSSRRGMLSADGRFAVYESLATDLVPGDTNDWEDIFLYDHKTGQTSRISVSSIGTQANDASYDPHISADGRYVVYSSDATNLVAGDTNLREDIFRYDRIAGETIRVNVSNNEAQSMNGHSNRPDITPGGNLVVFRSFAPNLIPGDTNESSDIFVRDISAGTTTRISVSSNGTQSDAASFVPTFSRSGRFVMFESDAANLVSGDTNGFRDVFVHDRETGITTRESVSTAGVQGNDDSTAPNFPAMSADGRWMLFRSDANNLVSGDTNTDEDVFLRDRVEGTTTKVSATSNGTIGNDYSCNPVITPNSRFIAFETDATNLVTPDLNCAGCTDILGRDRNLNELTRYSENNNDVQGNDWSLKPSLTANAKKVLFYSWSSNYAAGDIIETSQMYVKDTGYNYEGCNDFTANGIPDVLVRHAQNGWWRSFSIEDGVVVDTAVMGIFNSAQFTHKANADFDNDGDADVLVRKADGTWLVFEVESGVVIGSAVVGLFTNSLWEFMAAYDFDDDGDADILVRKSDTGLWRIFEMQEGKVVGSAGVGIFQNALWTFQAVADFDGDGDGDVLARQSNNNLWKIFNIENRVVVNNNGPGPLFNGAAWVFATAGDMDQDGVAEIVLRNAGTGVWRVFRMLNRAVASVAALNLFTNALWVHAQTGDMDADGDVDITLRKTDTGAWRTFEVENRAITGSQGVAIWTSSNLEIQN